MIDRQKGMWDRSWNREDIVAKPWVDGLDLSQNVDCVRGIGDENPKAIIITFRTWDDETVHVYLSAKNLEVSTWAVYEQGKLSAVHELPQIGNIQVTITAESREEIDIVIIKYANNV